MSDKQIEEARVKTADRLRRFAENVDDTDADHEYQLIKRAVAYGLDLTPAKMNAPEVFRALAYLIDGEDE